MSIPTTQKALVLQEKFGDFVVEPAFPVPSPGTGEVLVKIHATASNPVEWKIQKHGYNVDEYPAVLGVDIAGEVVKLGGGVASLAVGDRVFFQGVYSKNQYAGFQEYAVADVKSLAKIPPNVSYDEAATIPAGFDTAFVGYYQAHPYGLGLKSILDPGARGAYRGEPIVVLGGSGAVGQYAIQLAKLSGFSPIITTASLKHEEYLKSLGATHVVDRTLPLTNARIQNITDAPVKVVFDAVANDETQKVALEIVASEGKVLLVLPPVPATEELSKKKAAQVVFPRANKVLPEHADFWPKVWANVESLVEKGDIKPLRVELLPGGLNGIPAGLKLLEGNRVSGVKLVARPQETIV